MKKFQDWSTKSINFQSGCEHDCKYCYAKGLAYEYSQIKPGEWNKPKIRFKDVNKRHKNYGETVMFPSSHDITLRNRRWAYSVLSNLLGSGNQVLIVTKPTFEVIKEIVDNYKHYRDQILFRFTVTSLLNSDPKHWEPGAPNFQERLKSLRYAYDNDYHTSVSIEPMLNADTVVPLFYQVGPFVTDTIWLGQMNHQEKRPVSYDQIKRIYNRLKNEPKVQWKTGTI